jgi:hypothetical protein
MNSESRQKKKHLKSEMENIFFSASTSGLDSHTEKEREAIADDDEEMNIKTSPRIVISWLIRQQLGFNRCGNWQLMALYIDGNLYNINRRGIAYVPARSSSSLELQH